MFQQMPRCHGNGLIKHTEDTAPCQRPPRSWPQWQHPPECNPTGILDGPSHPLARKTDDSAPLSHPSSRPSSDLALLRPVVAVTGECCRWRLGSIVHPPRNRWWKPGREGCSWPLVAILTAATIAAAARERTPCSHFETALRPHAARRSPSKLWLLHHASELSSIRTRERSASGGARLIIELLNFQAVCEGYSIKI